jgi:hypothetical protein
VPSLRIGGAILPLPPYAFMMCTGTNLPLPLKILPQTSELEALAAPNLTFSVIVVLLSTIY